MGSNIKISGYGSTDTSLNPPFSKSTKTLGSVVAIIIGLGGLAAISVGVGGYCQGFISTKYVVVLITSGGVIGIVPLTCHAIFNHTTPDRAVQNEEAAPEKVSEKVKAKPIAVPKTKKLSGYCGLQILKPSIRPIINKVQDQLPDANYFFWPWGSCRNDDLLSLSSFEKFSNERNPQLPTIVIILRLPTPKFERFSVNENLNTCIPYPHYEFFFTDVLDFQNLENGNAAEFQRLQTEYPDILAKH